MTNRERFMTALRGGTPDEAPVSPLIHGRYAHKLLGRSDLKAMCEAHDLFAPHSFYHRGVGGIHLRSTMPDGYRHEVSEVERTPEGRVTTEDLMHTPYGTLRSRHVVGMIPHDPLCGKTVECYVKSEDDWKIYRRTLEDQLRGLGEPEWSGYIEIDEWMGERHVPVAHIPAGFISVMHMRGMQEILTDLYDCPDLIRSIVDLERQIARRHISAFVASPAEAGYQDICWATGAVMGPKLFERWCLPDVQMAADLVGVAGKLTGLYTLGHIRDLMPMFADAGTHFVETFEPNEGDITLAEAKRLYGKKMCILGNYDCTILAFGTVEDARNETLRCLREGMEGEGGFVLITGDEVPADTKFENLKAMVDTVAERGRYE